MARLGLIRKGSPLFSLFFPFFLSPLAHGEEEVQIRPLEAWNSFFAGQETKRHFTLSSPFPFKGKLAWRLSLKEGTIARGEVAVSLEQDNPQQVGIHLKLPHLKEGVSLGTELSLTAYEDETDEPAASRTERIWILTENPFAERQEWLKGLQIRLFDPVGMTEKALQSLEIPFESVYHFAYNANSVPGCTIVGEGASLEKGNLCRSLLELAKKGETILCLAPADGVFVLQDDKADEQVPLAIHLRRNDLIQELDKRLDATAWPPDGTLQTKGVVLAESREVGQVLAEVVSGYPGWPWLEMKFESGGSLSLCGFSVIEKWNDTPTPRFLLLALLERGTPASDPVP